MNRIAYIILALIISMPLMASEPKLCDGFLPPNDLYIPAGKSNTLFSMDEQQFNSVIESVEEVYAPIVAQKGGKLQINRKWTDGTVNANASRKGSTYVVNMYGGLARHEAVTLDGFAMVVCHELGHHIGGAPTIGGGPWGGNAWASNEGQSDYFATTKCLRRVFLNDASMKDYNPYTADVPEFVNKSCTSQFRNSEDFKVCVRSAMAGLSLANLFKVLRKLPHDLSFETPDTNVVSRTNNAHPAPQCRLDTYFQGSLCEEDYRVDLGYDDENQGACSKSNGQTIGFRPRCWFKPADEKYNTLALQ